MERLEELNNRLNKSSKELADANQREDEMRSELGRKEKDLALVKHELKEMQRKVNMNKIIEVKLGENYGFEHLLGRGRPRPEKEGGGGAGRLPKAPRRRDQQANKRTGRRFTTVVRFHVIDMKRSLLLIFMLITS